jgi:hypothetical protein
MDYWGLFDPVRQVQACIGSTTKFKNSEIRGHNPVVILFWTKIQRNIFQRNIQVPYLVSIKCTYFLIMCAFFTLIFFNASTTKTIKQKKVNIMMRTVFVTKPSCLIINECMCIHKPTKPAKNRTIWIFRFFFCFKKFKIIKVKIKVEISKSLLVVWPKWASLFHVAMDELIN